MKVLYKFVVLSILGMVLLSCHEPKAVELYQSFRDQTWCRFDKILFEIPVTRIQNSYDLYLVFRHAPDYPYANFYFNLVMTMPSGEERIMEYEFPVRSREGKFLTEKKGLQYEKTFPLRRELFFSQKGMLKLEIENLIPKTETIGVKEIGILMLKHK